MWGWRGLGQAALDAWVGDGELGGGRGLEELLLLLLRRVLPGADGVAADAVDEDDAVDSAISRKLWQKDNGDGTHSTAGSTGQSGSYSSVSPTDLTVSWRIFMATMLAMLVKGHHAMQRHGDTAASCCRPGTDRRAGHGTLEGYPTHGHVGGYDVWQERRGLWTPKPENARVQAGRARIRPMAPH